MVASMTAFSRQSSQKDWGVLIWELRTVNHRFLDLTIRLPELLREFEPAVRAQLSEKINRGKIEASLRYTPAAHDQAHFNINEGVLKQIAGAGNIVRKYFPEAETDMLAILAWPGVLETQTISQSPIGAAAIELLEQSIASLIQMRQREGGQIKVFIQQRLDAILALINQVLRDLPQLLALERGRIESRIAEWSTELNVQRLEQEMALVIQKTDVAEEIQRLNSHCQAMHEVLTQPGAIGRRLDFLSQELHREATTLSSKALGVALTQSSIEMRVLIEQIREQVQNIE